MKESSARWPARSRNLRIGLLTIALIATFIVIGLLSREVVRKIDMLATANSDNVQWTLSQVEVEFLRFDTAVLEANATTPPDLGELRQRFDVLYSRIETLRTSAIYASLRLDPAFAAPLAATMNFLDRTVPLIDGDDAALKAGLLGLAAEARSLGPNVRTLALRGIGSFAAQSDAGREAVSTTLLRVGVLSLALLLALVVLLGALLILYRKVQNRSTEIQTTSARLKAIISTSLDAILVVNREGRVLDYNGAAETIFGYGRGEVLGERMSDLVVPDHHRAAHEAGMARYNRTGVARVVGKGRIQLEAKRKSGEVFPVEMSISSAEDGEVFISFLRDISSRKAAEQALMKARDDALSGEKAKAELLAVMSHEMRTPLNGLLGTMELLNLTELSDRQRRYLGTMQASGDILLHHVNDVLDIARLDAGATTINLSCFDAGALLDEVASSLEVMAGATGNTLTACCLTGGLDAVMGDPRRLRQVLLNLVGNAAKFTHNGEIALEAERLKGADTVEFRVTDTGIGIADKDQERVFDDFVTLDTSFGREAGGTGLGLAITRRLIHAMGGEIGLESEPGEGSLFWVRLPLPRASTTLAPAAQPMPPSASRASRPAGQSVLVVEDNAVNRTIAREMLERLGATVTEARDGVEGVALAGARRFDLILMDISMPRMDGVDATKAIRSGGGASSAARIAALTAHALPDDLARFTAAGMERALLKPVTLRSLSDVLDGPTLEATVPTPGAGGGLIDEDILSEVRDHLGAVRTADALHAFISEADETFVRLEARVGESTPLAEVAARVHRLGGSAAIFGVSRLHCLLKEAETAAKGGDVARLSGAIETARASWADHRRAVLEILERVGPK